MGLSADDVIGIQLPNIIESILTILGVMRAGMIAAPLPLLWRRADAVAALGRIGVKALITCGRVEWLQSLPAGDADRLRTVFDPLCVRLRLESARWRCAVR